MEQLLTYKVDLSKIQGEGDFQCPKCGVTISPVMKQKRFTVSWKKSLDTNLWTNGLFTFKNAEVKFC